MRTSSLSLDWRAVLCSVGRGGAPVFASPRLISAPAARGAGTLGLVSKRDPIALVEACYALQGGDEQWLQAVADAARPLMRAPTVIAYHIDIDDKGIHIARDVVQSGDGMDDVAAEIRAFAKGFERRHVHRRLARKAR